MNFFLFMIAKYVKKYYILIMKVNIVCVGKIKEKFFTDAINEYLKRLSRFAEIKITEVDEASNITNLEQKSKIEGERLLAKSSGIIVALDGGGKLFSSNELADFIHKKEINGESTISFIIGGSNGLSKEVLSAASLVLSFGKITFPHQLFRVVLTEQIYRAFTIIAGLPYHK